uniref:Transmembrane protein n=1 Tax=Pediastrum duplex TaxID=3105 RepID=A0A2U8GIS3_PEDDU|nr:hypothetical protein [Pediastrum duplex]
MRRLFGSSFASSVMHLLLALVWCFGFSVLRLLSLLRLRFFAEGEGAKSRADALRLGFAKARLRLRYAEAKEAEAPMRTERRRATKEPKRAQPKKKHRCEEAEESEEAKK